MLKKLQNKKGFTLMEMLIVVAIIAVLVAIAIPVFNGALTKSKEAADVANVRATYAEWQTAMLTENTKAPADKDAFLKGPTGNDTLTLNYLDKLTVADGTITEFDDTTYSAGDAIGYGVTMSANPSDLINGATSVEYIAKVTTATIADK